MNARRGTVVELLGAPGAGKTGLAAALSEVDGVSVVKDHTRHDLAVAAWSVPRSLPVVLAHPPDDVDWLRWVAWAGRLAGAPRVARSRLSHGSSTVVFDQGAAYTLVRMLDVRRHPSGNTWWWRRSVETAALLDVLLILDADTDTLVQRVLGRDKGHRVNGSPLPKVHDYLAREREACHLVADVLAREGTEVRRLVTTDVSLAEQTELVLDLLHRRTTHRV